MILVRFNLTLLETKYIACKIVNKRSLNIKIRAFRELNKTHPSGMSKIAVGDGRLDVVDNGMAPSGPEYISI